MGLSPVRVLHLCMHEKTGAGRAALRLHHGLLKKNSDSLVYVSEKISDLSSVTKPEGQLWLYRKLQLILISKGLYKSVSKADTVFSVNVMPSFIHAQIKDLKPDIINLHWIGWEFLRIEEFKNFKVPLVWTLHDMWAFTGGCHYSQGCDLYTKACGACPQIHSSKNWDLSRWIWQRKVKAWKGLDLTIVTPSSWLAQCASNSSLFQDLRIEVIPNGLDTKKYKPTNCSIAREHLSLPQDKFLILFGALQATGDPRKGFHFLQPALKKLSESKWQDKIELVIFGSSQPSVQPDLGFKCHFLGKLNDDISLALVYGMADVFVAPSTQDNLPNTVMEALACGTPCVAFKVGGMTDMIEHQQNGYLAQPFETEDLAQGIAWVLEDRERHQKLCDRAREKVEHEFTRICRLVVIYLCSKSL